MGIVNLFKIIKVQEKDGEWITIAYELADYYRRQRRERSRPCPFSF